MPDDNTPKESKPEGSSRAGSARTKAQAEFDRYKSRVAAPRAAMAFGAPPAFSIPGAGFGAGQGHQPYPGGTPGGPWGAQMPWPVHGRGPVPPQLGPDTLTDRLRTTVRLGVDVVNATLVGGLRVMGGLADITSWAWSDPSRGYHGHCGCGCGGGSSSCGCQGSCGCHDSCGCDCCTVLSDPCCSPRVSSCGCGCC